MADTKCVLNQRQTETSSVSLALRGEDVGVALRLGCGECGEQRFVCAAERRRCVGGVGASLPVISCGDKRTLCKTHKFYSILISFILFFCSALLCSVSFRFFFYMLFVVVVALSLYTHTRKVSSPPHPHQTYTVLRARERGRGLGKKCKQLQLRVLVMSLTMPAS